MPRRRDEGTQAERLLAYVRRNPGCTSLEITRDLFVVNVRGRVHELREMHGDYEIVTSKKQGKYWRYYAKGAVPVAAEPAATEPLIATPAAARPETSEELSPEQQAEVDDVMRSLGMHYPKGME